MSRLFLAVGFPDTKPTSTPALVYLGRSGAGLREAMDQSTFPRLLVCSNLSGIPKNNPRAAANLARQTAAAAGRAQQKADRAAALDIREADLVAREKTVKEREDAFKKK